MSFLCCERNNIWSHVGISMRPCDLGLHANQHDKDDSLHSTTPILNQRNRCFEKITKDILINSPQKI